MTHLSPQITHLVTARPMSVTMGNAIRELKLEISGSDIDMPEQDVCYPIKHVLRVKLINLFHRPRTLCVIKSTIIFVIELSLQTKLFKNSPARKSKTVM